MTSFASRLAWMLGSLAVCTACASGGYTACKTDSDPTVGERCQHTSGDYGTAATAAATAAGAWAVVGCTVNGCEPPNRCNEKTKMCEPVPCSEDKRGCPPGLHCDLDQKLCR